MLSSLNIMDTLYHQTSSLLHEISTNLLHNFERSQDEEYNSQRLSIQEKLDAIHSKEPVSKRTNARYRVDQLKYDYLHLLNSFQMIKKRRAARAREEDERNALLSHKFTTNESDTSLFIDHDLEYRNKMQGANQNIDEIIGASSNILKGLQEQGGILKGAQKKLLDLANTLGLSNTVMRLIERRTAQDKYVLFGGMILVLIILYLLLKYI